MTTLEERRHQADMLQVSKILTRRDHANSALGHQEGQDRRLASWTHNVDGKVSLVRLLKDNFHLHDEQR